MKNEDNLKTCVAMTAIDFIGALKKVL